jgi:NOL1/NOP2/sun family putative RNA methylase
VLSLPKDFITHIEHLLGDHESRKLFQALEDEPVTSVRLNKSKYSGPLEILANASSVPWCENGYYLNKRPSFTFDPAFHAGAYYVQEASSMFLEQIIRNQNFGGEELLVLDLCAAPGGKSTHLASLIPHNSILISNEVISSRVNVLAENLQRWGKSNVIVTNNDPEDFHQLENCFDIILVDAPCSGEGMFRKDPGAINEWSQANVDLCSARQKRILEHAVSLVKPGGILIYSTCTFSVSENEEVVKMICDQFDFSSKKINTDPSWGITETITSSVNGDVYGYRFYPHKVKGEGLFISCLQKDNSEETTRLPRPKKNIDKLNSKSISLLDKWVKDIGSLDFILFRENILAVSKTASEKMFSILNSSLKVRSFGTEIGQLFKEDLAPAHQLAMSELIHEELPFTDLTYEEAIAYLQKKDIKINSSQKGWNLLRYNGLNLGWGKILPNRMNNYYPTEWRIRKEL